MNYFIEQSGRSKHQYRERNDEYLPTPSNCYTIPEACNDTQRQGALLLRRFTEHEFERDQMEMPQDLVVHHQG